jgi:hypothetical protein
MSTLTTRPKSRPGMPKSKVLLVRQPVRQVRRASMPDRTPMRLALGVVIAIGVVAVVWLMGHLGYQLGFAPLVHVPNLLDQLDTGLATGTLILISSPQMVFEAGLAQPFWLMLGFTVIAIPAAGLAAAKPVAPGGPRPKREVAMIAGSGAVIAVACNCMLIWWTASANRLALVQSIPADPHEIARWQTDLQVVAGLDILSVVAAALWVVLVMRLPIAIWLKAIAASAAFFTLVVVTVAMSITNGAAAQIRAPRALAMLPGDGKMCLLIGSTPQHLATLVVEDERTRIELRSMPEVIDITGRQTIVRYVETFTPRPD